MKAFKLALLGAVFSVSAIAAAQAADVYSKGGSFKDEPNDLPAITWTGFYVGAHAGATFDDGINIDSGASDQRLNLESDTSFEGGFQIGYNRQFWGNWVGGIEVDYTFMDSDTKGFDGVRRDTTDYLASVRGRLGRTYDRTFYYGTAGVAFLGWDNDVKNAFDDDTAVGFVVGGGIDYKLNSAVSVGFETLYYRFDDTKVAGGDFDGQDAERDFTIAQVRLNYHLNGLGDPLEPLK